MIDNRDGRIYLDAVLEKIRQRILSIDESLLEGQKEIDEMHEYYWQNYTEMDEYGYENFDNQQALLHQIKRQSGAAEAETPFSENAGFSVFRTGGFLLRRR